MMRDMIILLLRMSLQSFGMECQFKISTIKKIIIFEEAKPLIPMRIIFLIFFSVLLIEGMQTWAQNPDKIIKVKGKGRGYYYKGEKVAYPQIWDITLANPESARHVKIAKTDNIICGVILVPAICLVTIPSIVQFAAGKSDDIDASNRTLALGALGVGLIFIGFPFAISGTVHTKKAIRIYNNSSSYYLVPDKEINIGLTANGLGVSYRF
jgi:hypothetical protein